MGPPFLPFGMLLATPWQSETLRISSNAKARFCIQFTSSKIDEIQKRDYVKTDTSQK